jgi:hypothetical protein
MAMRLLHNANLQAKKDQFKYTFRKQVPWKGNIGDGLQFRPDFGKKRSERGQDSNA